MAVRSGRYSRRAIGAAGGLPLLAAGGLIKSAVNIGRAAISAIRPAATRAAATARPALPAIGAIGGGAVISRATRLPQRTLAAGRGAVRGFTGQEGPPRGYHLAKDGSGRYVRNRSMNPGNAKALRRALRRVESFRNLVKRTVSIAAGPRRVKAKKRR